MLNNGRYNCALMYGTGLESHCRGSYLRLIYSVLKHVCCLDFYVVSKGFYLNRKWTNKIYENIFKEILSHFKIIGYTCEISNTYMMIGV